MNLLEQFCHPRVLLEELPRHVNHLLVLVEYLLVAQDDVLMKFVDHAEESRRFGGQVEYLGEQIEEEEDHQADKDNDEDDSGYHLASSQG